MPKTVLVSFCVVDKDAGNAKDAEAEETASPSRPPRNKAYRCRRA